MFSVDFSEDVVNVDAADFLLDLSGVTANATEVYTIDNTAPTVAITRDDANPTNANSVVFSVDFSEDVVNVSAA